MARDETPVEEQEVDFDKVTAVLRWSVANMALTDTRTSWRYEHWTGLEHILRLHNKGTTPTN